MKISNCSLFTSEERRLTYEIKDRFSYLHGLSEIDKTGQLLDRLGSPVKLSGDYELIAKNSHSIIKKLGITIKEGKLEKIKRNS